MYQPSEPFSTPVMLLKAEKENVKGVEKRIWKDVGIIYVSFKTYGGTDTNVNGIYTVVDTASVETWYRPDITAQCAVRLEDGTISRHFSSSSKIYQSPSTSTLNTGVRS